ncbi:mitochondrial membrane protein [Yamadazyma tenuis]|uniref:Mitochondrial fission 1 protein n=1 Tax=Candida tenuis (strain ATCC 10573 / BCRC 21748 / CBS 615 / JCM 9827 / NBRC 10315 / NRRL Y-1498 / VKM Y-70) TaxID=590646 RepID=G3B4J1_CANTC|nr:mitochondrial fission 1 protein [Yamadazyma tenuis ATCC 10573]EGV63843.1 mitochondrial fission 1 protein [Yamadazyma tenuis ATCC 10573]WEJ96545.1 mitochondrial membrane protein [Yamadazyma tenuis]
MSNLLYPALKDFEHTIPIERLNVLRNQVESENPDPSAGSLFNYAWGLIKTKGHKYNQEGVEILKELYRKEPDIRKDCLYYLSMGSLKLGDYTSARQYIEELLKIEPDNSQGQAMKNVIEDKITKEGLIGLGIAGGILAVGVGIIGALIRRKR